MYGEQRSTHPPLGGSGARSPRRKGRTRARLGATTAAGAEPVRGALSIPTTNAELRRLDVELDFLDHQMIGERHRLRAPAPQEQRRHLPEPPQPRAPEPSRPFIGRGRRPPFVGGLVLVAKPRTSSTVSPAGFGIDAPAPVTVAVGGIGLVGTAPPAPAGHSIRIAPRLDRLAQVPTAQGSLESLVKPMRRPSAPFDAAPHGASNANANARQLARIPPPGAGCGILRASFASSRVRACARHVGRSQVRHGRG